MTSSMILVGITVSWPWSSLSSLSSLLALQNGYETDVGEKSALLSGGQKQVGDAIEIAHSHHQIQALCCATMFFFSVGKNGSICNEHGNNALPSTGATMSRCHLSALFSVVFGCWYSNNEELQSQSQLSRFSSYVWLVQYLLVSPHV